MTISCPCAVCIALAGLPDMGNASLDELAAQLPESVSTVLAAQARVTNGTATDADRALVRSAAAACRTGRLVAPPAEPH